MNLSYWLHIFFVAYTILLFVRIVTTWFPQYQYHTWVRFVSFYTDPYLSFFRRVLPPLGGVLDLSPVLAFLFLQILEALLRGLLP